MLKDAELSYKVGKSIKVYIDPDEPTVAILEKNIYRYYGYMISGFVLFFIASALYGLDISLVSKKGNIKKNGHRIQAQITDIYESRRMEILGKRPKVLSCEYFSLELNRKFTFESVCVWNDLQKYFSVGEYIEVAVDTDDWGRYYVDIDRAWKRKKEERNLVGRNR